VTRWVWSHAASEIRKKPPSFLPRGASRLSLLGYGENYSCTRRGPERGERGRGGMNEGYKEGGGRRAQRKKEKGANPAVTFSSFSPNRPNLSHSPFFFSKEKKKKTRTK
jgi:hypothetical protein